MPPYAAVTGKASRTVEHREPRDGYIALATVGRGPRELEIPKRQVGIECLPVLAPSLFVRLQVRHLPARLTDLRAGRRRIRETFGEHLTGESMLRVTLPVYVERELNQRAEAFLAVPQRILCLLALGDIAHQAQKPASVLFKLANPNLNREGGAVLAPMASLETDRLPGDHALLDPLNGRIVETDVEIAFMFADQLFPAVAQALAGLAVDVYNGPILVKQEKGVGRVIDEAAKVLLARAQLSGQRGYDQRRRQKRRDPLNIFRKINAQLE